MSLLSRNELDIVLYPERIELLHAERKLTLRGYEKHVRAKEIIPAEIPNDGEMSWQSAVRTLEMKLPSFIKCKMKVNVTLSNHFMHYTLVPWVDKISDEDEMVFARHFFRKVYGIAADSWSVRISPSGAGFAALASSVDTRLLDELRKLLGRMGLNIKSIQPHLMVAFNSCQASLEGRNAWIALLEPGNLCLAALRKGRLVWIRKLQIGNAWQEELPVILEREAFVADAEIVMNELFLWAPHLENTDISTLGRWQIHLLKPGQNPGHAGIVRPVFPDGEIANESGIS